MTRSLIKKYPYVYAWHKYTLSYDYYIQMQIQKAIDDGAPANAIYRNCDGHWSTYDEIKNPIAKLGVDTIYNDLFVN